MGLGDVFSGGMLTSSVLLKFKVDVSDAKRGMRELTGEEKKAAQAAIELQEKKNKQLDSWAKGIAKVTGGMLLAQKGISMLGDAWKAYEKHAMAAGGADAKRAAEFRKAIEKFDQGLNQFAIGLGRIVTAFGPVLNVLGDALGLLGSIGNAISGAGRDEWERRLRESRTGQWDNRGQWSRDNEQRPPLEGPQWGDWRQGATPEERAEMLSREATALATQQLRQFANLKSFHTTQIGVGANMAKLDKLNKAIEASMGDFGDEITEKLARTAYHQINAMVPGGIGTMQNFLARFQTKKKGKGGGGGFTLDGGEASGGTFTPGYSDLTDYGKEQQFQQRMADMARRRETQRWADSIQPGGDPRIANMLAESKSNLALSGALDFDPSAFMAKLEAGKKGSIFESVFGKPEEISIYSEKLQGLQTVMGALSGAMLSSFEAWKDGSLTASQALAAIPKAFLSGIASMAAQKSLVHIAEAVESLIPGIFFNPAAAAGHAKVAAIWGAIAIGSGAAARAMGAGTGAGAVPSVTGGGGGGGGGTQTNYYFVGDGFSEDGPAWRKQKSERMVRMGRGALSTSSGVSDG